MLIVRNLYSEMGTVATKINWGHTWLNQQWEEPANGQL